MKQRKRWGGEGGGTDGGRVTELGKQRESGEDRGKGEERKCGRDKGETNIKRHKINTIYLHGEYLTA